MLSDNSNLQASRMIRLRVCLSTARLANFLGVRIPNRRESPPGK